MKEILKKDLLAKLNESSLEMDEMSKYNPGREEKNPWDETPEERAERQRFEKRSVTKSYRFQKPPIGTQPKDMPPVDVWIYSPTKDPQGERTAVIPTGLEPITEEELRAANPKFFEWAQKEMGDRVHIIQMNKVHHDPLEPGKAKPSPKALSLRQKTNLSFETKDSGPTSDREKILRSFNPIVSKILINQQVNDKLIESGFPPLKMPDQMFKGQKAAIDRHSTVSNNIIHFGGHNYDFYLNIADFAQANEDRLYGDAPTVDILTTHMPRQYNHGANWDALRPTENMDLNYKNDPLTPLLKLAKRGYRPEDRDVAVSSSISIRGVERILNDGNSKYEWTVDFSTLIGKKLKDQMRISGNDRQKDKNFTCTEASEPFLCAGNPLQYSECVEGLVKCLNKIKGDILSMDVTEELESRSVVDRSDITQRMNEDTISKLVSTIMKEIKRK